MSGLTREELVDRLSGDSARLIITAGIVQAAMSTTLLEKLVLLGESLARLTADEAQVDRERLLVRALDRLEAPHVHVLGVLCATPPRVRMNDGSMIPEAGWPAVKVGAELPQYSDVTGFLIALLVAEGLVVDASTHSYLRDVAAPQALYLPTDLGNELLELLH